MARTTSPANKEEPELALRLVGEDACETARTHFLPLAERLVGSGSIAEQLALRVAVVGGWQQLPSHLAKQAGGRTESMKRLGKVARLARKLEEGLGDLNPLYLGTVASRLHDLPALSAVTRADLQKLAEASEAAAHGLRSQGPGRPADVFTRRNVRQLLRLTEQASGRRVTISKGKAGIDDARLTGPGGDFIRHCFRLMDPGVAESSLVRHTRAARQELQDPAVLEEDRNSLEIAEFLTLNGRITPA